MRILALLVIHYLGVQLFLLLAFTQIPMSMEMDVIVLSQVMSHSIMQVQMQLQMLQLVHLICGQLIIRPTLRRVRIPRLLQTRQVVIVAFH